MSKLRHPSRQTTGDERCSWRVVDDFPSAIPVGPAELDAVEAFLMKLVDAILSGKSDGTATLDSEQPQKSGQQGR